LQPVERILDLLDITFRRVCVSSASRLDLLLCSNICACLPRGSFRTFEQTNVLMALTENPSPSFWLLKSEPSDYSIVSMERDGQTVWDGVRNPLARKHLREMRVGDLCLFYHSSAGKRTGIAGVVKVDREAYPDPEDTKWAVVDVMHAETWQEIVTLDELKQHREGALVGMMLFKSSRLSVQPVSKGHFEYISRMLAWKQDDVLATTPSAAGNAVGGSDSNKKKRKFS